MPSPLRRMSILLSRAMPLAGSACVALALAAAPAAGTCTGQWLPGEGLRGVGGTIAQSGSTLPANAKASIMWDRDGPGGEDPVLVVGGGFSIAGNTIVNNIAIWNGSSWEALGLGVGAGGTANAVNALAVMPNGDLVAAGTFTTAGGSTANNIARWNGTAWSTFGTGANTTINALAVTTAGDLIVGGLFTSMNGSTVNRIARWNDTTSSWSSFTATNGSQAVGLANPGVNALIALPDGNLLVGGGFLNAGGGSTGIHRIAIWDTAASAWLLIASGVTGPSGNINAMLRLADGNLYVGGSFSSINSVAANNIALWDGSAWSSLDDGVGAPVRALCQLSNGNIAVGGDFANAGAAYLNRLGRWDGTEWTGLWSDTSDRNVYTLSLDNAGNLIVGGNFVTASGIPASGVAVLNDATWEALGNAASTNGVITSLAALPGGEILAGGAFTQIEGAAANRAALFTGGQWAALGDGLDVSVTPTNNVKKMLKLQNGDIVAAGEFQTLNNGATTAVALARYSNGAWTPFSTPGVVANREIRAMIELPNGELVVGGNFESIDGVPALRVARWDGASWHAMGDGIDNMVEVLAVLPNGQVVAGGNFDSVNNGTVSANGIAYWDGTAWNAFFPDLGQNATVRALQVMPNGDLIAAGGYISVGLNAVNRVARWDGTDWHTLSNGIGTTNSNAVYALALMPNGDLIAGGEFTAATGVSPAPVRIARWNGTNWSAMGAGCDATVYALAVEEDGTLLVGGNFTKAGGLVSVNLARWECPEPTGACCVGAACSITTAAECAGDYQGDNTLCENVSCCPADFNGVNGVTVQDIFDFLTAWLAGSSTADFNGVNGVTVQDIFDFLTAWLAGC